MVQGINPSEFSLTSGSDKLFHVMPRKLLQQMLNRGYCRRSGVNILFQVYTVRSELSFKVYCRFRLSGQAQCLLNERSQVHHGVFLLIPTIADLWLSLDHKFSNLARSTANCSGYPRSRCSVTWEATILVREDSERLAAPQVLFFLFLHRPLCVGQDFVGY